MYANEDEFVRGQKLKILIALIMILLALLAGCGAYTQSDGYKAQCRRAFMLAQTRPESLYVLNAGRGENNACPVALGWRVP
jgi:hypothetical protein